MQVSLLLFRYNCFHGQRLFHSRAAAIRPGTHPHSGADVSRTGVSKSKAELAVETVFEAMKRALERGERIELRGFGVFNVRPRKTGIGRNPRTGEEVTIPPGKAVRFKPGKELQNLT